MSAVERLAKELEREAKTTRRFFDRLPPARLDWRPHPKSRALGELASHLVQCFAWPQSIFTSDELDFHPADFPPAPSDDLGALLAEFDATVIRSAAAIRASSDVDLERPWRLKFKGRQLFERPRAAVLRDFTLGHLIHHRGQLSVYLRLLDVPVPGAFGPTADE
jgi:uncharacterized damage-inducible protein DinB